MGVRAASPPRHFNSDGDLRRRREGAVTRVAAVRRSGEAVAAATKVARTPPAKTSGLMPMLKPDLLRLSVGLLLVGALAWCALLYRELQPSVLVAPAFAAVYSPTTEPGGTSTAVRSDRLRLADAFDAISRVGIDDRAPTAASVIARDWRFFDSPREVEPLRAAAKEAKRRPQIRLASLESATPPIGVLRPDTAIPRFPASINAKTSLIGFETAPFPYHGDMPGSNRPFLNAGEDGRRGHVNFRGRVFWETQTYSDNRVLLHIPPGFDPQRPAVMVVFFHGHGADLAHDVRDRQRVPAQITAAGMNAVLVAPQFAVDAADSSAGKFWEPNGFKRFLDEAAVKLALLSGDPHSAAAFAKMPIVIVAYSGGFGTTLSVLDRGGVRARIRGLVMLDALYGGIDKFADWIANNRTAFFISSYTPHTAWRNAYLERLLGDRAVPYSSQLRRSHLQGMVAFLPAGDVSHRDFVTHAWADNPVENVLVRMDDFDPKIQTAAMPAPDSASAFAAAKRD